MIVGFAGYARVGKHEAAKGLEPLGFKTVAFADKLREMLWRLNPIVDGRMWVSLQEVIERYGWEGYKETEFGPEIRRLIQTLGTDCGRDLLGDSIWIDSTFNSVDSVHVSVADVRFPNEAQAIKDRGGYVIKITKHGIKPANNHISETALDDWGFDAIIMNDYDIYDLHATVRNTVKFGFDLKRS